jgi:precorrin-6B methylase 2
MISETDTVWDIGAEVGLSASKWRPCLAWTGVRRRVQRGNLGYIRENLQRFGAYNVELVEGYAPPALAGLPVLRRFYRWDRRRYGGDFELSGCCGSPGMPLW